MKFENWPAGTVTVVQSAWDWKRFYADERRSVGSDAMLTAIGDAEAVTADALVIPHTRLTKTGTQFARAVKTVLASGADRVVTIGVLHGARRGDAERVARARAGDRAAVEQLRGIHTDDGLAAEEFSLDTFTEMVQLAARHEGRHIDVVRRYPFLVGSDPASLPGLDEVISLTHDSFIVATTDPMHHGDGYGTPLAEQRDASDATTLEFVLDAIDDELSALREHRYADFAALTATHQSDFRDSGPVLAELLTHAGIDPWHATIEDLALVPYADVLHCAEPTWVAAALVAISPDE